MPRKQPLWMKIVYIVITAIVAFGMIGLSFF